MQLTAPMLAFMTQPPAVVAATAFVEIVESTGGLAVEHGRIARLDGRLVVESFQTRLTTRR